MNTVLKKRVQRDQNDRDRYNRAVEEFSNDPTLLPRLKSYEVYNLTDYGIRVFCDQSLYQCAVV